MMVCSKFCTKLDRLVYEWVTFSWKIGLWMVQLSNYVVVHPYQNQTSVPPNTPTPIFHLVHTWCMVIINSDSYRLYLAYNIITHNLKRQTQISRTWNLKFKNNTKQIQLQYQFKKVVLPFLYWLCLKTGLIKTALIIIYRLITDCRSLTEESHAVDMMGNC